MIVLLQNTITGKFWSGKDWNASVHDAQEVEQNSPTHAFIKLVWDCTHVKAWPKHILIEEEQHQPT